MNHVRALEIKFMHIQLDNIRKYLRATQTFVIDSNVVNPVRTATLKSHITRTPNIVVRGEF